MGAFRKELITAKVETITPVVAEKLLKSMGVNRTQRPHNIRKLIDAMKNGVFNSLNGESVIVDSNGSLIDGQHRMMAIIESGATLDFLVVRGVEPKSKDSIDQGVIRTAADVLGMNGAYNANILAGACRWVWIYENEWPKYMASRATEKITTPVIQKVFADHPELEIVVEDIVKNYPKAAQLLTPTVATFMRWATDDKSSAESTAFFHILNTGESDTQHKTVLKYRDRLFDRRSRTGRMVAADIIAMGARVWNSVREGKALGRLYIGKDPKNPYANTPRFL